MIKKFNQFGKVNEDNELKKLSDIKVIIERSIELNRELVELSDKAAQLEGYDNWYDWFQSKGNRGLVQLLDGSMPKRNISDLEDYLEDYYEEYKKDKIVSLHRNRKNDKPNIPGNE